MPLLEVNNLSVAFARYAGGFQRRMEQAIVGLDLSVEAGEIVAVIGSSGSGKSLLAHAVLGILPGHAQVTGTIQYDGEPLNERRIAALRGNEIVLVPQSVSFLDPLQRVGAQVRTTARGTDPTATVRSVFKRLRLAEAVGRLFPFQLSGGMARRVLVSTAAVSAARLIVADEPTPGMQAEDVNETLSMLREMADKGSGVLLITHDIEAALRVADKVAVFYAGTTVELAKAADFAGDGSNLRHPYSRALWQALPRNGFKPLPGTQPSQDELPSGCLFAPRCPFATEACSAERPAIREVRGGWTRCFHAS
ncbi:ABC transporter ATP-binding protein [Cohnella laeviribosi]|uniref:ABC transporter ATP-binding protein n=1 Tax=Cohnella laeviribosi TaxID=380174 RepID=UPI0003663DCB|nr:ABC transporter ATP-binding protein [Cohnella laeviribosi]